MSDLRFDISSLHAAYASGVSPLEMIDMVFKRIDAAGDPGIFLHLAGKAFLVAEVKALGPFDPVSRPLWGIPFAVKDNIDVAGMPTTAACPDFAYHPAQDATVVALLKAAGAIVVGKTNLDQFATGLVGVRTPHAIPRNAFDEALIPGGSSSGSAVATARGIVTFALGTDTAGSGRIPAGLNNIIGLKPTVGAISASGVVPACRTLDCVSIFALTVDDAYKVYATVAKPDSSDPYSKPVKVRRISSHVPVLTIGVPAVNDRVFYGDNAMRAGFDEALATLLQLGCRLVEIPFKDFYAVANLLYDGAWVAERFAAIADFMAVKEDGMHPVTAKIIGGARRLSAADAFNGLYTLQALRSKLAPVIASVDMFCVPTAPTHYTADEVLADPIVTNSRLGTFTNFVNLLDLCGMAVPCGLRGDGRPMSVTLLAPAGQDGFVAGLAGCIHEVSALPLGATGWRQPTRVPSIQESGDGEIELVVVGAHMTGMPLNGELRKVGANFRRALKTIPAYQLFALAGQSVPKPGLLRRADGKGAAIDVEVWSLQAGKFGTFVDAIPVPLGIGTISLADGSKPKGFLVESAGLEGAVDISELGGWRSYVKQKQYSR